MDLTVENIEKAVQQFYYEPSSQQEVHRWLTAGQMSQEAWSFSWQLLKPEKTPEVQFFGANTLHLKISRYWHELKPEQCAELRTQLLELIVNYAAGGPRVVLTRLCITLSAFVLQSIPDLWSDPVKNIITTFQQANVPNLDSSQMCQVLLEILRVLPEEYTTAHLKQSKRGAVKNELQKGLADVLPLLQNLMSPNSPSDVFDHALKCLGSWIQFGIPMSDSDPLIQQVFLAVQNESLFDTAIDALCSFFSHPDAYRYPDTVQKNLIYVLRLEDLLRRSIQEKDMEVCQSICRLIVTVAENHTKILLTANLSGGDSKEQALKLVQLVLQCSAMPGNYPVDECCSDLSFSFWYILQDDISMCERQEYAKHMVTFSPVYMTLMQVLLQKVQFPPGDEYNTWNAEEKESHRCYRQDISDTVMYAHNLLRDPLIGWLCSCLASVVERSASQEVPWQEIESVLFLISAVSDNISMEDENYLQEIFALFGRIPFTHIYLISRALYMIGAFAEWINGHPEMLGSVVPLILQGLPNPQVATAATIALKDVTREGRDQIRPYAHDILTTAQTALATSTLKTRETVRLMACVGHVLSVLPYEEILQYLNTVLTPHLQQLQECSTQEPSPNTRAIILLKIDMLSWLFGALNTKLDDEDEKGHRIPSQNAQHPQPILPVLQQVIPILEPIITRWIADPGVVEGICDMFKRAIRTLADEFTPLISSVSQMVAQMYSASLQGALLDLAKQILVMFGREKEHLPSIKLLFDSLCNNTLSLFQTGVANYPDVVEVFMTMLSQLVKKNHTLFMDPTCNLVGLFQSGIIGLGMQENLTVKSSCSFLSDLICCGDSIPVVKEIVTTHGHALVERILRCVAGESPRAVIDPMADVFLALSKRHFDEFRRWIWEMMAVEGFPVPTVNQNQKQHFARLIINERVNKRKMKETVKEFSLLCRGLIGTEYANQAVAYL